MNHGSLPGRGCESLVSFDKISGRRKEISEPDAGKEVAELPQLVRRSCARIQD
jgi:hypothetical protein